MRGEGEGSQGCLQKFTTKAHQVLTCRPVLRTEVHSLRCRACAEKCDEKREKRTRHTKPERTCIAVKWMTSCEIPER